MCDALLRGWTAMSSLYLVSTWPECPLLIVGSVIGTWRYTVFIQFQHYLFSTRQLDMDGEAITEKQLYRWISRVRFGVLHTSTPTNSSMSSRTFWVRLTLQKRHCTEKSKQIFPEMKLRGLVANSYIHVQYLWAIYIFPRSVSDTRIWKRGTRLRSFISGNT